jgi:autotransporter translocation and assembly factor TamB
VIDGAVGQYLTEPRFNLRIASEGISLPEIGRVVKAVAGIDLRPQLELTVDGPLDAVRAELTVLSSAGELRGAVTADVAAPGQSAKGSISVRQVNLAPILEDPELATDLTADVELDLRADAFADLGSLEGRLRLDAPRLAAAGYEANRVRLDAGIEGRRLTIDARASAYGTDATANGRVDLAEGSGPHAYDLRGSIRGFDLRRLPPALGAPPASTAIDANYRLSGREPSDREAQGAPGRTAAVDLRFDESDVAGALVEAGSTIAATVRGANVAYRADVGVRGLDLEEVGRQFEVAGLASERYRSDLNGRIAASGRGTSLEDAVVDASGSLADTSILGGRIPRLAFQASLDGGDARMTASGEFAGFDPSLLSGQERLAGEVGGTVDLTASIANASRGVTPESVAATIRLELEPSSIGELTLDRLEVDADYSDRRGEIRRFEIAGPDLNVMASGALALDEAGRSDLTFHADTPSLEPLGRLGGLTVSGIAEIEGRVTGNGSALRIEGMLAGNGVRYGEQGVLALEATYDVRLPDLAVERVEADAGIDATFVSVGGQEIDEITGTASYENQRLAFDLDARQRERQVAAAGALTIHPDHRELHLDRLALDARMSQWELAPGTSATIRYGGDGLAIDQLVLVSGPQRIVANGTVGAPGGQLDLTMSDIGLEVIDAILLREPQFSGTLDLSATVATTAGGPRLRGEFQVAEGGFREFRYESLAGTVDYAGRTAEVDVRLQQNPEQWMSASGRIPIAMFQADPAADKGGSDPVDVTVDSSPIDLGIVQGFTTEVTDVSGTLEVHLKVEGTAARPRPSGGVSVTDGALVVAPTGVAYHDLDGRIDLQPDRVRIDRIAVLDPDDNALTLSGSVAIAAWEVGDVRLSLTADDFKLLDNEMGEMTIRSDVEVSGDLRALKVEGEVGLEEGEINLDALMAAAGPSAYSTAPIESEVGGAPAEEGGFAALTLDVRVTVPDDLVVQADDLQIPGSSGPGLGALGLTLGGDLRALKEPGDSLRLVGEVNTIRGTYDFQGRRFEILRGGSVQFQGLDEIDPSLDLRALRTIRGVEAYVNIRGTLRQPEIVLSSVPPLEQGDILALIVFNQPVNELGRGEQVSLAQRAQALAAGAVAGQLAESIGDALSLDTFEINLAPESGGGAEVTLGEQVGENLYVRVQQGIGERGLTNFVLEYEILDWLRLRTNVLQGSPIQQSVFRRAQGSGIDLIFLFSY